jgi:uncharacterized membrane protein YfcA
MQIVGWLLPGLILGAFLGGLLLTHIPENVEKWIIVSICCVGFAYTSLHIKKPSSPPIEGKKRLFPYWRVAAIAAGIILGMYVGVSGAGSGTLTIAVITFMFRLDMKSAIFVMNVIGTLGLGAAALTYWYFGLLDAKLLAIMAPACCLGGVLSSQIVHAVPERALRITFACCIALLILHMTLV